VDVITTVDGDRIAALKAGGDPLWIDLSNPSDADVNRVGELLGLHPVAVEDTREFGQRPKVDVYQDNVLLVFYSARIEGEREVRPLEIHVYVGANFILTVRRDACDALDELRDRLDEIVGHPVYEILDTLTDAFYPVIEHLEDHIDALEYEVLNRARREQLGAIYRLRQDVRELARLVATQRDQFHSGASDLKAAMATPEGTREYLRDIGDHLSQISGELNRQHDDLQALTSTYFNANSDRLNAVATRLTVLGTLFVLWTLVTGFFGQNFQWLTDNVETLSDFLVFGLGALLIPTVTLLTVFWVKRRDWF
jgi:magnesium transporter